MNKNAVKEFASGIRRAGDEVASGRYDLMYSLPEAMIKQANIVIRSTPDWSEERKAGLNEITDAWRIKVTPLFSILANLLEEHEVFLTNYLLSPNGARRYPKTWLLKQLLYASFWGSRTNKPLQSLITALHSRFGEAGISEEELPEVCDRVSFILVDNKVVEQPKTRDKRVRPLFDALAKTREHQLESE